MTDYANSLLDYTKSQLPKGADAEAWFDSNINPLWRKLMAAPEIESVIVDDCEDDE